MQVRYGEGVATHTGPEPCGGVREDVGEASVGEHTGQPLSRERVIIPGRRRRSVGGRQYGPARYRERLSGPAWSETLACVDAPCAGTGRSLVRPAASAPLDGIGKAVRP